MEIEKKSIKDVGTCNFCNRGLLNDDGCSLSFPYTKVYVLSGKHVQVRLCEDCMKRLKAAKL